jgi:hypothetical protein
MWSNDMINPAVIETLLEAGVPANDLANDVSSFDEQINALHEQLTPRLLAALWYILCAETEKDPNHQFKYAQRASNQLNNYRYELREAAGED